MQQSCGTYTDIITIYPLSMPYSRTVSLIFCFIVSFITMLSAFQRHSHSILRLSGSHQRIARSTIHLSPLRTFSHVQLKATRKDLIDTDTANRFCITTPIYYVNGEPHLGHAYTSVLSDIIARYYRKYGQNVFFLSGTDEHGQKVAQSAAAAGKTPIEFADEVSGKFRRLMSILHCSHDDFIRTTEDRHKQAVEYLWKVLEDNNQIYLGAYEGWYSIRDEAFYQETELVNGKAPTGADVSWVKEESYFFRLSAYTDKLLQLYQENPDMIGPKGRRNEVLAFLTQEGGLKDLSISRTTFSWGIPVPGNPKHVVYVWLDALVNYISALGYPDTSQPNFQQFWPANVHIVGKDILRFHTIYWPAFLMAANLPVPKKIFAHGWWTKDGEKMSKSLGNVLDPFALVEQYGVDYVRYFLASEIHFGNDGDFSHDSFAQKINAELANDFGNLIMRVLVLIQKFCGGKIPTPEAPYTPEDFALLQLAKEHTYRTFKAQLQELNIKSMVDAILMLPKEGNRYINLQAPWELAKTNPARMRTVLYVLSEVLRSTTVYLEPIIPTTAGKIFEDLGVPESHQTLASVVAPEMMMPVGVSVTNQPVPLFPRVEMPQVEGQDTTDSSAMDSRKGANSSSNKNAGSSLTRKQLEAQQEAVLLQALVAQYAPIQENLSALEGNIVRVANMVREKKALKAAKEEISPLITELKFLKDRYKLANQGVEYVPAPTSPSV